MIFKFIFQPKSQIALLVAAIFIIASPVHLRAQRSSLNEADLKADEIMVDTATWLELIKELDESPLFDEITFDKAQLSLDTSDARRLMLEADALADSMLLNFAFNKADSARQIYILNLGYESLEVAESLHSMGSIEEKRKNTTNGMALYLRSTYLRSKICGDTHTAVASSFYNLANQYEAKGDYKKAIAGYSKAVNVWSKVLGNTHPYVATTLINIGNAYWYQGKPTADFYLRSLEIRLNSNPDADQELAILYNNIGLVYSSKGKYEEAIKYLEKALEIRVLLSGYNDRSVASTIDNIGVLFINSGKYDQALKKFDEALNIRKLFLDEYHPDFAFSHNNIAIALAEKGEYDRALKHYFSSMEIRIKNWGPGTRELGTVYTNIGDCYSQKGEYDRALEYLYKAVSVFLPVLGENHPDLGAVYNSIGNVYWYQNEYYKAIPFYKLALTTYVNSLGVGHPQIATVNIGMGNCYSKMGLYDMATTCYEAALNIRMQANEKQHPQVATIFNNLGDLYVQKGDYQKALEYIERSMQILPEVYKVSHPLASKLRNNLGDILVKLDRWPDALSQYEQAIVSRNLFGNDLSQLPGIDQLLRSYQGASFALSRIYRQSGDPNTLKRSEQYIENALAAISHEIRTISPEKYASRQASYHALYELALDIYSLLPDTAQHGLASEFFTLAERSKGGLLRSGISASDALSFSGIPDSLLAKEYDLRIDINWREKQRQGLLDKGATTDDPEFLNISALLFDLKREQEDLIQTFEENYPDYYALKYDLATISLDRVQQSLLSKDQSLVEYFKGDSTLFTMVVTRDSFAVVSTRISPELDSLVRQLNTGLYGYYGNPAQQSDALYRQTVNDYIDASTRLYQLLIEPVKGLLRDELIIIPDGILSMVPFETLLSAQPENTSRFDAYPYVIKDHSISYSYSATLLDQMKNRQHKAPSQKTLIAFAPFYEGSYALLDSTIQVHFDSIGGRDTVIFEDLVMRNELSPLPSSGEEVKTATSLWDGQYYINRDATEERFTTEAGDYRIVHLSTHGVADARQGDYSYLAFAEVDDDEENELLFVRDIYNIPLNADLVVLSACETARGELQKGEGVVSLARAFAYAGAKSMVTSLWKVDDSSTRDLMKTMYLDLRRGAAKDRALRNAKLQFLKKARRNQKHPFFWAGFIGVGDMSPIR